MCRLNVSFCNTVWNLDVLFSDVDISDVAKLPTCG